MLALSPTLFSTCSWPLDDLISQEQTYIFRDHDTKTPESFPHRDPFPNSALDQPAEIVDDQLLDNSRSFTAHSGGGRDTNMVRKLNHNASERDRRKKINSLYSSLRSLLPATDQTKKLTIPATVLRVLKYIPELQQEVGKLDQKKEELLSKISRQDDLAIIHKEGQQRKGTGHNSLSSAAISASQLGDREVVIQISTYKIQSCPLSQILLNLEESGLSLLNSSSFETFGGRVFYTLHLRVGGSCRLNGEALIEKLESLLRNTRED